MEKIYIMSQTISLNSIGKIKQNKRFEDWWESSSIEIPFLNNKKLSFTFLEFIPTSDPLFISDSEKALTHFLQMGDKDRDQVTDTIYNHLIEFLQTVKADKKTDKFRSIQDKNEIWNYVKPQEIYVSRRPTQDKDIYLQVACSCDWDKKDGLQLVFRQGKKLTRISTQDGHLTNADALCIPDEKDEMLMQF